jgi:hypothetical protein
MSDKVSVGLVRTGNAMLGHVSSGIARMGHVRPGRVMLYQFMSS